MSSPIGDYVAGIRAHIGHDPLLLATVSLLPRGHAGNVLLRAHAGFGGWGLIGGALNVDEDPRAGAIRKAREVGLDVGDVTLVDVYGGPGFRMTYPNGDQTINVCTLYSTTVPAGAADKHLRWFSPAQLATLDRPPLTDAILRAAGVL